MKHAGAILIVDDNPDILIAARLLLKQHYQVVKTTDNPFDIEGIINAQQEADQPIDVILLDMNFTQDSISGQEGFYWLKKIAAQDPSIVVLLMTAYSDIQLAVDAIKAGAADFIAKPWQNEQLLASVAAAFNHGKDKRQVGQLKRQTQGLNDALNSNKFAFLGQSQAMQQVFDTIAKAAQTDANILITGESGTGKELTAHAIHQQSLRHQGPFIGVDMGAMSASLLESELFGHKKGAFTDAKEDRVGRFELANGGSLFLDELGNLPLEQQVKLLAALQNRQITPLGGTKTIDVDIRLISATNDNLHQSVSEGRFRQDLLYRINTVEIALPSLRERREDIPLLVDYYLNHFGQKYKRELGVSASSMRALSDYPWPGNVRELAHAIERAVILSSGTELDIGSVVTSVTNAASQSPQGGDTQAFSTFNLEELEHQAIRAALTHYQGNVSHAAKALGLTRGAMYRRLEKYGL
ncbi:sigma-54 dependent transcriptional regulator [Pseudoalteromonas sp. BDTF-M6]|uniref:sigma-54-dependent transcriptional regulator n=1 Tax=Pseudoalteromonas sp. BDTF-M6 TaxID=2796132 RepID=UPI001BAF122E|nr:sigma-54 dependent transcriptional regulator [Pseudoalteromonas sp. BDTF-M6]MBS3797028.1 sigma-54-dependent Fis family transcriptional regulator [Pseudoalteromonas sp. BDTF-M6]